MPFLDRMELKAVSTAIAMREDGNGHEGVHILRPPEGTSTVYPLSYTTIYMVPNRPKPRLHRAFFLATPFPRDIREASTTYCLKATRQRFEAMPKDAAQLIIERATAACEAMEDGEDVRGSPFEVLGLQAIYQTDTGSPFAAAFANRVFVAALAQLDTTVVDAPEERWAQAMDEACLLTMPRDDTHPAVNASLF